MEGNQSFDLPSILLNSYPLMQSKIRDEEARPSVARDVIPRTPVKQAVKVAKSG